MSPTSSCTFSLDLRHHNNLKYSACNTSPAHLASWLALLLRRRFNLDSGAQHRLAGAFCDFSLLPSSFSRTEAFVFLISLTREKSGLQRATSCSPQENASCSIADRCVCEPKSRASAARWHLGRILVFVRRVFSPLVETSVDVKGPSLLSP